ncbi:MAG: FliH/SctL family protein [Myxococcota bacterium]
MSNTTSPILFPKLSPESEEQPPTWLAESGGKVRNVVFPSSAESAIQNELKQSRSLHPEGTPRHVSETGGSEEALSEQHPEHQAEEANSSEPQVIHLPPDPEVLAELEKARERFVDEAARLASARTRALQAAEKDLLELATWIAEAILETELSTSKELHLRLVHTALETLAAEQGAASLRVSVDAHSVISEILDGEPFCYKDEEIILVQDDQLPGLSCIAETMDSSVDVSIRARIRAVAAALESERIEAGSTNTQIEEAEATEAETTEAEAKEAETTEAETSGPNSAEDSTWESS